MGEERFGPYELLRRVAVGGMAEIFAARRCGPSGFAKLVALKRVLPELARQESFRQMFADEARLCATLSHPGLVSVFDYGDVEGTPYLVMEWVEGCDLATLLASGGPLPLEVAAFVIAEVARALAYVHEARDEGGRPLGIVHRDLSPGNVLVSRQGDVKVGDFGVAKARGRLARTDAGRLKGTLAYLAPEQVGGGAVDGRADVYAAGLLLFELATGERYVRGESEVDLLRAAAAPAPRAASSAGPGLERLDPILARALAVEPACRHGDAATLERELRRLAGEPARAREALAARVAGACGEEAPRRRTELVCADSELGADRRLAWLRRNRGRLAAALAALLLPAAGVGLWLARPASDPGAASLVAPGAPGDGGSSDGGGDGGPGNLSNLAVPAGDGGPPTGAAGDGGQGAARDGAAGDGGQAAGDGGQGAAGDGGQGPPVDRTAPPGRTTHHAPLPPRPAAEDAGASEAGAERPSPGPPRASPPAEDLGRALREADGLRAARGLRAGDDRDTDRLRAVAAALVRAGADAAEVEAASRAYAERVEAVAIDRPFIDAKMRRATERMRRAGSTPELDRLSQEAIRQVMAGDLEGANRTLNRILDLTR